ncbi:MAG TPA: hypothetical protein VHO70_14890 [Chitinispirillaceae bacterium]|nr:hypothetical protein [Chitinispirillaceae bacterium]
MSKETEVIFKLHPGKVIRVLSLTALLVIIASVAGQVYTYQFNGGASTPLIMKLYIDGEENIATFFVSAVYLISSLLLYLVYLHKCNNNDKFRFYWFILSAGFLFLAVDESVLLYHDLLSSPLKSFGMNINSAVGIGIATIILFLILYESVLFFIHLPGRYRILFALSGVIYIAGSVGMDKIGTMYHEVHSKFNLSYSMLATLEAMMEIGGVLVLIYSLLTLLSEIDSTDIKKQSRSEPAQGNSQNCYWSDKLK